MRTSIYIETHTHTFSLSYTHKGLCDNMCDITILIIGCNNGIFNNYIHVSIVPQYSRKLSKTIRDSHGRVL